MKNIFLSDLHIGVDAPTNLYKSKVHEPSLKAILKHIQENGSQIRDVVILGDWIDLWMYTSTSVPNATIPDQRNNFLPTTEQIIEANPTIFNPQTDNSGDFVSCLDSIQGNFYYVNGNHDITVSGEQLNNHFKQVSKKGREIQWIDCLKEPKGYTSALGDIYGAHGHWSSMVCRPYPYLYESVPLGYFITRVGMDAQLICYPNPLPPLNVPEIVETMKNDNLTFSQAVLTIIAKQANTTLNDLNFTMPDGKIVSANDVSANFPFPDSAVYDNSFVTVDTEGNLDDSAAKLFTEDNNLKIVLYGHTHISKAVQDFHVQSTYANTGFLCAGQPNIATGLPISTFVEIEDNSDDALTAGSLPYKVNMYYVDFASATLSKTPLCSLNVNDLGNLALNKPVVASSVEPRTKYTPNLAVDGNESTRWSSAFLDSQWIYVDLERFYNVNRVILTWEDAYGKSYKIQVSDDAVKWTDVYTTTTGNGDIDDISFPATKARYVRMYGTERPLVRNQHFGYSLYEFKVYAF